eukprot:PLAT12971.2.p1 GENE.PLAT12971.2~~PLAT12971.2.p1  ORF type:complete len:648 (+),score=306.15 PLAT12971.2:52-1944(+)
MAEDDDPSSRAHRRWKKAMRTVRARMLLKSKYLVVQRQAEEAALSHLLVVAKRGATVEELVALKQGGRRAQAYLSYLELAYLVRRMQGGTAYRAAVLLVVLISCVVDAMQTYNVQEWAYALEAVDGVIVAVFVVDVLLSVVAEGGHHANYFRSGWNLLDVVATISGVLPKLLPADSGSSMLGHLKALRALRLIRLGPLRVLVLGLLRAVESLGYITLLMALMMYLYGVLAVTLFGDNDPLRFGTLHLALVSLWQSATLDDWTDIMYTAMYGCDSSVFGGGIYSGADSAACVQPYAWGPLLPSVFFVSYTVFASMILLNLFIGAIVLSMEEAKADDTSSHQLTVHVIRGTALPAGDASSFVTGEGSSDPYVKLRIGTHMMSTAVLKRTTEPVWDEQFTIKLDDLDSNLLELSVYDWDRFSQDDMLGEVTVDISTLPCRKLHTFELELNGCDTGSITVSLLKQIPAHHRSQGVDKDRLDLLLDHVDSAEQSMWKLHTLLKLRGGKQARAALEEHFRALGRICHSLLPRTARRRLSAAQARRISFYQGPPCPVDEEDWEEGGGRREGDGEGDDDGHVDTHRHLALRTSASHSPTPTEEGDGSFSTTRGGKDGEESSSSEEPVPVDAGVLDVAE